MDITEISGACPGSDLCIIQEKRKELLIYLIVGLIKRNYNVLRLDFSIENEAQTKAVVEYYLTCMKTPDKAEAFPTKNFTNGHYKRGVE